MGVLSLGSAVFDFAVNSGQFVQGITEMGAGVAGFANKTTGTMGGVSATFKALDDKVFNVTKTVERFTRGFRDADPALRRAYEGLYTYRQEQNRLEQAVTTANERLVQQEKALVQSTQRQKTQESNITALIARQQELKVTYEQAKLILDKMNDGTLPATAQQIDRQKAKVDTLGASWLRQIEVVKSAQARLDTMKQSHETLGQQIDLTRQRIQSLNERQERTSNAYDLQKDRIKGLTEKIKAKALEQKKEEEATTKVASATQKTQGIFGSFNGQVNLQINAWNKLGSVVNSVGGTILQAGQKIGGVMTVAFGTIIGTAINGAAASVQGFVTQGLEAYRGNERLTLSLKELVATELQAKDASLTRTQALAQASDMTKDLLKWTQDLAIKSPFSQDGIANAFKMSKALGFTVDESKRVVTTFTDWASATGKSESEIQRVILALGQMQAKGKVSGEELMQLTEAGIGVREILAKQFGISTEKLVEMQEKGLIPAKDAIAALADAMDKDYGGAAGRASDSMEGLLNSLEDLTKVSIREFFTGTFQAIQPYLKQFVDTMTDPAVTASIREIGDALGQVLGTAMDFVANTAIPALIDGFNYIAPAVQNALAILINFGEEAYNWGAGLMEQYGQGIIDAASYVINAVMDIANTIMDWMMPHSPPRFLPHIDDWGRETAQLYFDSFGDADFSAIEDVGKRVENLLSGMKASGELGDNFNVSSAVIGSRQAMIDATAEFKRFGSVSTDTLNRIRAAGGPVGDMMADYAASLFKANTANKALADAQEDLTRATAAYDKRLALLDERMKKLTSKQTLRDTDKQIQLLKQRIANAAKLPAGLRPDVQKMQDELESLQIQQEQNQVQRERDAAAKVAQAKVDAAQTAADAANAELAQRQAAIDLQQQQINLMKELVELQKEQSEEKKKGSNDAEKQRKKEEAEAKKKAAEAKRIADAQFEAEMATASAAEQVDMLQEKLNTLTPGTEEYYKIQKRLFQAQEKRDQEQLKANRADLEASLLGKDKNEQLAIYQEYLSHLTPDSEEYRRVQEKIVKLQEDQAKSQDKLNDKEEAAKLATMDRAEKIEYYRNKLAGLKEGTEEYYDTLAKLNALEKQESDAKEKKAKGGKGKGDAPKPGGLYKNPLAGVAQDMGGAVGQITTIGQRISGFFDSVNAKADALRVRANMAGQQVVGLAQKIEQWRGPLGAVAGILSVVAANAFWLKLGELAVKLQPLIGILLRLASPLGLIAGLAAILGAAIATNFGGIRDIIVNVWSAIQGPLGRIWDILTNIIAAFQEGGFEAGVNALVGSLPALGLEITKIFDTIWQGILLFFGSDDMQQLISGAGDLLAGLWDWITGTGIPFLVSAFQEFAPKLLTWLKDTGAWLLGQLGTWGQALIEWVTPMIPPLLTKLGEFVGSIKDWIFSTGIPMVGEWIGSLASKVGEFIGGIFSKGMGGIGGTGIGAGGDLANWLADIITHAGDWLLGTGLPFLVDKLVSLVDFLLRAIGTYGPPLIGELISFIGTLLTRLGAWLLQAGLPRLIQLVTDLVLGVVNAISRNLPLWLAGLGYIIGRLVTQVASFVVSMLATFIVNIPNYIWNIVQLIAKGFWSVATFLYGAFFGVLAFALGAITGIVVEVIVIGRQLVMGIWDGIKGAWEWLKTNIGGFVTGIINWFKELFGIHSPSTVFFEIATNLIQGLVDGWNSMIQNIKDAILTFVDWVLSIFGLNRDQVIGVAQQLWEGVKQHWTDLQNDVTQIITDLKTWAENTWTKLKDNILNFTQILWDGLVGGAGWIVRLKNDVSAFFTELMNLITGNGGSFVVLKDKALNIANTLWDGLVGSAGWITKLFNSGKKIFEDLKNAVVGENGLFSILVKDLLKLANDMWNGLFGENGWISKIARDLPKKISDAASDAKDALGGFAKWVADGVSGFAKQIYDAALNVGDNIISGIKSAISSGWSGLQEWLKAKFDRWFNSWWSSETANAENDAGNNSGGGFAVGTDYAPGGTALVGERGPEMVELPRGSRVLTATRTTQYFNRMAEDMARSMGRMMQQNLDSVSRMSANAAARVGSAVANSVTNNVSNTTIGTGQSRVERHDHWNLTINSQAPVEQVVHSFETMQAISGVS